MAGYLGKISAIVSANTADFQSKLNASAKDVSSFAKAVQSNLTSASRSAAKSLEGIYTPLQRFERALQAAGSKPLSFKGFPGMIKDLDALQQRLNTALNDRQVDVVLKTTGLSSVSAVRDAIAGLKSKDIEIITRMGGLEKIKELQSKIRLDVDAGPATSEIARLQGVVEAANARLANLGKTPVTVAVNAESLDALNAKANVAREAVGRLMSGEFLGDKSLSKEISSVTSQVRQIEQAIARATAARDTLRGMESGRKSSPRDLAAAETKVNDLTGDEKGLQEKLAQLKAYQAQIKQINREIKEASAGGSGAVGGEEKERAAAIRAVTKASRELQQQLSAKYGVDIDITSLDQLVVRADAASGVIERLRPLIENLGKSDFEAAADSARKMQSAAAQIFTPLEAAVKRLSGLAVEFQAPFHEALKSTQADAERLGLAIKEVAQEGPGPELAAFFEQVRVKADGAVNAMDRLVQVSQQIGQLKTGQEFAFEQPGLNQAINRGAALGNQAASLPAEGLQGNPAVVQSLVDVRRLTDEAGAAYAKLLNLQAQKLPTSGAQAEVDALVAKIIEAQGVASREIKIVLDVGEAQQKAEALATKVAESQTATLIRVQQAAKAAEIERQAQSQKVADSEIANLQRVQQAAKAAEIERQAQSQKVADSEIANFIRVQQAAKAAEIERQAPGAKVSAAIEKLPPSAARDDLEARLAAANAAATSQPPVDFASRAADDQARRISEMTEAMSEAIRKRDDLRSQVVKVEADASSIESLDKKLKVAEDSAAILRQTILASSSGGEATIARLSASLQTLDAEAADILSQRQAILGAARSNDEADELRRRESAASNEVDTIRNQIDEEIARPLPPPPPSIEQLGRETEARGSLGKDLADSSRQTDALKGGITSLKSQIDSLPESVRARFIPAIRAAENEFVALATATTPLPGRIEAARQRVQQLAADATRATQAMNFGQSFGGAGAQGINLGLDQRSLQGYNAQLQILQGAIGRASAEARGPAVAAFERLRSAVATAFDEGNIDAAAQQTRLAGIRAQAIAAAAAISGVSAGSLTRDVNRAGDVGRGGGDKFALGLNQAAFAIDDFMSTSGGLEQKLRGVSNNITQLGFVVGGTTGLVLGLGAVMAGQLAVGILKFVNNGRTAEDQTKALNEALARQKSLVEELAQAFKSLGDSLSRGTFSAFAEQAREFEQQIESIKKKQREVRDERTASLDPDVQRERAQQGAFRRELEKETDIGQRIVLAEKIRESEEREKQAVAAAAARPPVTAVDAAAAIKASGSSLFDVRTEGEETITANDTAVLDQAAFRAGEAAAATTPAEVRQSLEKQRAALQSSGFAEDRRVGEQIRRLTALIASLETPVTEALDQLANDIAKAARGPAEQIRQAQQEVAEAIKLGLPGARMFQQELDKNAKELAEATKKLEMSQSGKDAAGRPLSVGDKERLTSEAQGEIAALKGRRAQMAQQSDALRYERTVDPQRQIDARMARAGGNLGAAGLEDGRIARRMREIENERETIRLRSAMPEFDNPLAQAGLQKQQQALNAEVSAIEAATIAIKVFAAALDRASEEAKGNLNSAQQAADEARRADLGNSTPQTQEDRARAEADLERQRVVEREAQTEIAVERDRLEQMQRPDAERAREIEEELKSGGEFDPGLVKQREQVGADAEEAEESRQKFQKLVDAQKAFSDAVAARSAAERALGITGTDDEREKKLEDAGRGDLIKDIGVAYGQMEEAKGAVGLEQSDYVDGLRIAKTELAAAIERQAQAAKALAEIDEKIAAAGMSGSREDLIRERADIQAKMEEDARTSQAKVDDLTNASTREEEARKSAGRGSELARKPSEKFAEETDQGLADIQTYFERRADPATGVGPAGDVEAQAEAEDRFRKDREKEARTATKEGRGRELGMTDRERFQRDMKEGTVADLTARAKEMQGKGEDPAAFLRQGIANQMESVAPMMKQLQMEREDMLLQGPSRKALQVSDVSTTQGASELTRLLRGDDSAKDLNLAELKKQSQRMEDLIEAVKAANPTVLL